MKLYTEKIFTFIMSQKLRNNGSYLKMFNHFILFFSKNKRCVKKIHFNILKPFLQKCVRHWNTRWKRRSSKKIVISSGALTLLIFILFVFLLHLKWYGFFASYFILNSNKNLGKKLTVKKLYSHVSSSPHKKYPPNFYFI